MFKPEQHAVKNRLLARMTPGDYALLQPHLEAVTLPRMQVLARVDQRIDHLHFLESGMSSTVAETPAGESSEVGVVGCEGFIDSSFALGSSSARFLAYMQLPGSSYRIEAAPLRAAMQQSHTLHVQLLAFVQLLLVQVAYTALSNATYTIEERLARWILMCLDRSETDTLPLTHDFLSIMLAVRRPSVTTTLHILEGERLITAERAVITVIDREGLEQLAGGAYRKSALLQEELLGREVPSTGSA